MTNPPSSVCLHCVCLKVSDTNVPIASVGITFLFWMRTRAWQLTDGLCSEPTSPVSVWHLGLRDVTDGFLPILITVRWAPAPFFFYEKCGTTSVAVAQAQLLCSKYYLTQTKMRLLNRRKVSLTHKLQLLTLCSLTPFTPVPLPHHMHKHTVSPLPAGTKSLQAAENKYWSLADVQRLGATFWRKRTVFDIRLVSL